MSTIGKSIHATQRAALEVDGAKVDVNGLAGKTTKVRTVTTN